MSDTDARMNERVAALRELCQVLMFQRRNHTDAILELLNKIKKTSQGGQQEMPLWERENEIKELLKYQDKIKGYLESTTKLIMPIISKNRTNLTSDCNQMSAFHNTIQGIEDETEKYQFKILLQRLQISVQSFISETRNFEGEFIEFRDKAEECRDVLKKHLDKMREKHKDLVQECENALKTPQLSKDVHSGEAEEHKDAEQPSLVAMAASISQPFPMGLASHGPLKDNS